MNKSSLAILLVGALLLAGLFVVMKPAPDPVAPLAEDQMQIVNFTVKDGQLAEGPATVAVTQGTHVTLRFISNLKDEAHLHGYDLSADLTPGETAQIRFIANKSGRFEIELHKSHTTVAALEIRPRG